MQQKTLYNTAYDQYLLIRLVRKLNDWKHMLQKIKINYRRSPYVRDHFQVTM